MVSPMRGRTVVSVAYGEGKVVVACNDGTIWHRSLSPNDSMPWKRLPEVPGVVRGLRPDEPA